jgi:hypothetical protein
MFHLTFEALLICSCRNWGSCLNLNSTDLAFLVQVTMKSTHRFATSLKGLRRLKTLMKMRNKLLAVSIM